MKHRMDIVYIGLCAGHGGDAVQMLELAAGMAARGHRVRISVPDTSWPDFAVRCGARGVPVEQSPLLRAPATATACPQSVLSLLRFFRAQRASLLHLHSADVSLRRLMPWVMGLLRLPRAFITLHNPYETLQPGAAPAEAWAHTVRARFHRVICPSAHALEAQIRLGVPPDRLLHIPNGVDVQRYRGGDGQRIRHELGLAADVPLVVFTSRLEAQKRPMDALDGFVRVHAQVPAAHLAFVGDGSVEGELRRSVATKNLADRVHFMGFRSDIPSWLAAATVWLLPTETENFSLGVLEALAAGCPILSTLCPGNDEVLVAGHNALIHPIGDIEALAAGLRRLLSNAGLRAWLSGNARTTAEGFSLQGMVERYSTCYEACA